MNGQPAPPLKTDEDGVPDFGVPLPSKNRQVEIKYCGFDPNGSKVKV